MRKANFLVALLVLVIALAVSSVCAAYTVPRPSTLLFSVNTDSLPASGNIGTWNTTNPAGGSLTIFGGNPAVETINGTKWERNLNSVGDGYNFGTSYGASIATVDGGGFSIVMAVKPVKNGISGDWISCVDIFHGKWALGVRNDTGKVTVHRNGTRYSSTNALPDQQNTVLCLVVQPDGKFKVWANGTEIMNVTDVSAFTQLVPGSESYTKFVRFGRSTDGWSTYNGFIGDTYVYKTALTDAERTQLVADLQAKFNATGITKTITGTCGVGGTVRAVGIDASGAKQWPVDSDQTYVITPSIGYKIQDVVVDGVSKGAVASYVFPDLNADHTIDVTFAELPKVTIAGTVTAKPGGGALVSFRTAANSLPAYSTTTDATGAYSLVVPQGTYMLTAAQTGYMALDQTVTATVDALGTNFTLTAGRNVPKMERLLFFADTNSINVAAGANTGNWNVAYPAGKTLTAIATPTLEKINGIKYVNVKNFTGRYDGYRYGTANLTPIACEGASVVTVVKPTRVSSESGNWRSIVDIFRDNLILGVENNNSRKVFVRRNGTDYVGSEIPDGQITILSLIVQQNGAFKVYASAYNPTAKAFGAPTVVLNQTATSNFSAFTPNQFGPDDWRRYINIGRNNGDNWTNFNGSIGDTFVYTTALSDAEREMLEADIAAKITNVPTYTINASAGVGGTISPSGAIVVGDSDNQTFNITPAVGYQTADVTVDGVSKGAIASYTFSTVTAGHTIAATFSAKPKYAVSGKVVEAGTGTAVPGAKVYVSLAANASVSPLYTLTADADGKYSVDLFDATWYVCASASGYATSSDITATVSGAPLTDVNVTLAPNGRNIPAMDQLIFSALANDLTTNAAGTATDPWPVYHPKGMPALQVMGTPTVETIDGVKWEKNVYRSGVDPIWNLEYDGYRALTAASEIPFTGATIVVAVKPSRASADSDNWKSIVDVSYAQLTLAIQNSTGILAVRRNGSLDWAPAATAIPDGQKTVLTLVAQKDGSYKLFANGAMVMEKGPSEMPILVPAGGFINVGRNNPDGWCIFNGNIGDVFLYKTALSPADCAQLEADLMTQFGIVVTHTIKASAGPNGTITPSGNIVVSDKADQSFTITPNPGYAVDDITVDGASVGAGLAYTFSQVAADHTIAVSFKDVCVTTAQAKMKASGQEVSLRGQIVTAVCGDSFYIEDTDRTCGIRVEMTAHGMSVGSQIQLISGVLATDAHGEKFIAASVALANGTGTIEPLGMNNKALGGSDSTDYDAATGAGQRGVKYGEGPNNIGLLVLTTGRVTAVGKNFFYIDDGYGASDGSVFRGVRVNYSGPDMPARGSNVTVTGISSIVKVGDLYFRSLRPRTSADIR